MPKGFSMTGGWDPPKPLAGQSNLEGEPTDALYRTLSGFKSDIKDPDISPAWRHRYQGAIENIQQELTYRGKLQATVTHLKRGRSQADTKTTKRMERAIEKLEDALDRREGTQRIKIPIGKRAQPTTYEISNWGVTGRYTRPNGQRGAGVMMQGTDGKIYAYRRNDVFAVIPDEANLRGEIPRQTIAARGKSLETKRAWGMGFAPIIKGGPGSGN